MLPRRRLIARQGPGRLRGQEPPPGRDARGAGVRPASARMGRLVKALSKQAAEAGDRELEIRPYLLDISCQ
jgi:hypothetical protein